MQHLLMQLFNIVTSSWKGVVTFISFLFSLSAFISTQKKIIVSHEQFDYEKQDGEILIERVDGSKMSIGSAYLVSFNIVNPSSNDIGYFDLVANAVDTNERQQILTNQSYQSIDSFVNIKRVMAYIEYADNWAKMSIPEKNYGIFPANSMTRLDIIVLPNSNFDSIAIDVTFKITKRSYFRISQHAAVKERKHFRAFQQTINTSNWKTLKRETSELWEEALKENANGNDFQEQ
ncbi:MAG TPA: hypothetical protein DDW71_11005 [Lactobacillus sp.]|nr:hypothetical protein [Lactobacillus sp.]